ncbi:MAG: polyprenol phosphomannose-dependent alpha 1,6 mannosyltransferase MptB [Pseudonocardiaceae bacterium]
MGGVDAPDTTPATSPAASTGLSQADAGRLDTVRRFGTVGALLMAVASLGAGTAPVLGNPVVGRPVLGLFTRMPTASLAIAYTGVFMVVLAWLWLGALAAPWRSQLIPGRLISRAQLDRTLVMWVVPLLVAPPMFSRDVYSYLAQSAMADRGLDPYVLGPAEALGVDHPLVRGIPTIWRNTPAPYGPLFLTLGRPIDWIAGDDVVVGALLHRTLALAGLVLIVWALPRLARRVGISPVFALWLGAANPLVLFHLVSGAHNEALMIGLMLAGLELALRRPVLGPALWGGTVLIAAAASVKVPAALALGFVTVWLARHRGGRLRDLVVAGTTVGGVAVATTVAIGLGTGLGFGWIGALDTPNAVRSWMSAATDLGVLAAWIGGLLGLGDHTTSVLGLVRSAGLAASAGVCVLLLWRCWGGRLDPLAGLGVGLGAVVLLGPVVHPWYLLWAAIPLAASATHPVFRTSATVASTVLALLVAPTGSDFLFRAWVVPTAIVAGAILLVIPLLVVHGRTPALSDTFRIGRDQDPGRPASGRAGASGLGIPT